MSAHRPRRRFGQHFLHDPAVLERIVRSIAPAREDVLVEIGPGEGALTRRLLEQVEHLIAIEIDRDLVARLRESFPEARLTLHGADALAFDYARLPAACRLVGNLPYNISTPLLFHLARFSERIRDMHFMLQLEVVDRMIARPSTPAYGRLSVTLQTRFRMERLFRVGPGAFRPPPKVDSAVVRLAPLDAAGRQPVDEAIFARLVAGAFAARRKKLRNALPLDAAAFQVLEIDADQRPENLSPDDYLRIARHLEGRPMH